MFLQAGDSGVDSADSGSLQLTGQDDYQGSEAGDEAPSSTADAADSSAQQADEHRDRLPDNFSRVDLSMPPAELRAECPDFPGPDTALVCELTAGERMSLLCCW